MNKDELMHYGILGMKWGHHKAKAPNSEDYTRYKELRKKKVSQLSTRELNELNSRMQAEDNYKRNKNNRDPLNKAYKMAVGVGLAITALETTHKALQRVKKNTKPVISNIYDRIKNLKHSDMDNDYLMHYGVLGMKWRNHIYKKKLNKLNKKYKKEYKIKNDFKTGIQEGEKFKNKTKNNKDNFEKESYKYKNDIFKEAAKLAGKRLAIGVGTIGTANLLGSALDKYGDGYKDNGEPKLSNKAKIALGLAVGSGVGLAGVKLKNKVTENSVIKNAKNTGYGIGLMSNKKDIKENLKSVNDSIYELNKDYEDAKKKLKNKYK